VQYCFITLYIGQFHITNVLAGFGNDWWRRTECATAKQIAIKPMHLMIGFKQHPRKNDPNVALMSR
jgi:hypothetical protein